MSDRADTATIPNQYTDDAPPPQDILAEQCALGAMLLSSDAIAAASTQLNVDDFYRPAHALIYATIIDLFAAGTPVDAVTILDVITRNGDIAKIGGAPYLHTLVATVPTASNATYYAQIVRERAILRRLIAAGTRYVQMGYGAHATGMDTDGLLSEAQKELDRVAADQSSDDIVMLEDALEVTLTEIDAIDRGDKGAVGIPTGFLDLDELTNGLHPQQLIVVGGRPGLGKSTLGMDFMRAACIKHNLPGVVFSLEMSRSDIVMRLISAEARIDLTRIRTGKMDERDWDRLVRATARISPAPLLIDDSPNLTLTDIRAKARRLKQQHDIRIILVDYLQLMSTGGRAENRQQEVASMSRSLKLLAKELDVPVIAISQLNRGPEQRHDKRPQLADLRESGAVEQDADMVILLHRDDYYEKEVERAFIADLIVAKHRNGPTRDVEVRSNLHMSRFDDLIVDHSE